MVAIILAGGKGERLRPFTNDRPKVMVEIAGKPIVEWQMEWMKKHGVDKFVLAVSYKHEVIKEYFEGRDLEIDYSFEETPLGRGGGIKKAFRSKFCEGEDTFIVANGDIITKADLSGMVRAHKKTKALVTDLVVPYLSRWGVVKLDGDHILGFEEKPRLPYWINGGVYIFDKGVMDLLPDFGDHETETFPKIPKEKFIAFKDEGFWRAVDVVKDKTEAEEFLSGLG